jgi:hypothetical protein
MTELSTERIPFGLQQETGWEAFAGAGQEAMNVVVDGKGAIHRRPGIGAFFTEARTVDATGVSAVHQASNGQVYAVGNGTNTKNLYRVTPAGVAQLAHTMVATERPVIAETQSLLVLAGGQQLSKVTLATGNGDFLGGSPPHSTHVAAMASRLVIREVQNTDLKNNFNYSAPQAGSGIEGYETWNGVGDSGTFPANARPDGIVALYENTNELFVFGESNLQTFSPDPQTTWANTATREFGCAAPYSVIKDDQSFAWLDDKRRFVHSDGRTFSVISDPIKRLLDEMDVVNDCFGYRIVAGVTDSLVWTFPTDGRTFVFSKASGWSQWSGWSAGWQRFPVLAMSNGLGSNRNLVGLRDGRMGIMSGEATTDLGDEINAYMTTGFLDHGTQARKHCRRVRLVLRKPVGEGNVARLSWRDGSGPWSQPLYCRLTDPDVVQFHSLGVYRQRQWKFEFMGTDEVVLAQALEEFEVLNA